MRTVILAQFTVPLYIKSEHPHTDTSYRMNYYNSSFVPKTTLMLKSHTICDAIILNTFGIICYMVYVCMGCVCLIWFLLATNMLFACANYYLTVILFTWCARIKCVRLGVFFGGGRGRGLVKKISEKIVE